MLQSVRCFREKGFEAWASLSPHVLEQITGRDARIAVEDKTRKLYETVLSRLLYAFFACKTDAGIVTEKLQPCSIDRNWAYRNVHKIMMHVPLANDVHVVYQLAVAAMFYESPTDGTVLFAGIRDLKNTMNSLLHYFKLAIAVRIKAMEFELTGQPADIFTGYAAAMHIESAARRLSASPTGRKTAGSVLGLDSGGAVVAVSFAGQRLTHEHIGKAAASAAASTLKAMRDLFLLLQVYTPPSADPNPVLMLLAAAGCTNEGGVRYTVFTLPGVGLRGNPRWGVCALSSEGVIMVETSMDDLEDSLRDIFKVACLNKSVKHKVFEALCRCAQGAFAMCIFCDPVMGRMTELSKILSRFRQVDGSGSATEAKRLTVLEASANILAGPGPIAIGLDVQKQCLARGTRVLHIVPPEVASTMLVLDILVHAYFTAVPPTESSRWTYGAVFSKELVPDCGRSFRAHLELLGFTSCRFCDYRSAILALCQYDCVGGQSDTPTQCASAVLGTKVASAIIARKGGRLRPVHIKLHRLTQHALNTLAPRSPHRGDDQISLPCPRRHQDRCGTLTRALTAHLPVGSSCRRWLFRFSQRIHELRPPGQTLWRVHAEIDEYVSRDSGTPSKAMVSNAVR